MIEPTAIPIRELLERYAGVLLDVYGVLFDASGPLPGAVALVTELARRDVPFAIVTNDASRLPETYARRFADHGLAIPAERIVTSGSLIPGYFDTHRLAGARTCVLGPADSAAYVRAGGGIPIEPAVGIELDALVVCDDAGYEFLAGVEAALSGVIRAIDAGTSPALVLPNPDLVYPKTAGELGITAGAIALVIEAALARRYPSRSLVFAHLGKPEPHLFAEAARRLGLPAAQLVMIGDQLETDIAGARAAGIDAALFSGVSRWDAARPITPIAPTWLIDKLAP